MLEMEALAVTVGLLVFLSAVAIDAWLISIGVRFVKRNVEHFKKWCHISR